VSFSNSPTDQLELREVNVLPSGDGFMLVVQPTDQQSPELRFPVRTLHQLMRVLPRVDAAMHEGRGGLSSALLAYPVTDWTVKHVGRERGVAIALRTDVHVESGFAFDLDAAQRFCHDLSVAITAAKTAMALRDVPATVQ
jgi:hypothetical protein